MEFDAKTLLTPRSGHLACAGPVGADELWIVLHGYGQLANRFLRHFGPLASTRRIVAPEGLSRFYLDEHYERVGASWMTRLDRHDEIDDCHRWLDAVLASEVAAREAPPRVTLLGFSQGAPTAGRWLLQQRPAGVERLICWGAGLPHDVDLRTVASVFEEVELNLVVGDHDEYLTAERIARERARMELAGIRARWIEYEGGHRMDRPLLQRIADRRIDGGPPAPRLLD